MPFLTPLALAGLLFVPLVLAFYLLKLRRDQAVVPSTLLWQRLVSDVEANAPWQRLRRSLLLLLQLLLVVILVLLAARPFVERPAGLARDLVLVVDTSASMQATDVLPSRLEVAKQAALDALGELPAGGKVSVIAAGRTAKVVANGSSDMTRVRQAIGSIEATSDVGDLGDALRLASALAARSGDAEILVATDAALAAPVTGSLDAPVRVLPVGRDRNNQAIVALAVRTAPSGVSRSVFVSVANLDIQPAERRIELYGDGQLLDSRNLFLDPQARTDVSIDDVPREIAIVEVRLAAKDAAATVAPDALAVDDRAWAIVPPDRTANILIVGEGDPYLESALGFLPNVNLWGLTPDRYPKDAVRTDGTEWDLIVFQGFVPAELPRTPILAIAPPRSSDLGDVTGLLQNPGIGALNPDEPILRYVDLSTTHIAEARKLTLPAWARPVIPGPAGSPLLYAGSRGGMPTAVLAFEPRRSDLPLQVAFPILLANLTGELLGGSASPVDAVVPGSPVTLSIPANALGVRVERPDGSVDELIAPTPESVSVTFARTELLGVYTIRPMVDPDASPAPSPGSSPSPGASPSPAASASPGAGGSGTDPTPPAWDPSQPVRFAVAMLDVDESNIAPGSVAAIERLGTARPAPGTGGSVADERPPARDELWIPIVLIALALLTVEWLVYERDTVARFRRGLLARFRGPRVAGGPG
jgi:Ca-activated chloride channel homolog